MKTNKKSFKKAALPVFGVLAAAVMSLTSVTYAWFTSGNEATVDTINVGVEAASGLQISMDNNGGKFQWSSSVKPNISGVVLAPVSTDGQLTQGKIGFYNAIYNDTLDKIHSVNAASDAAKSYITFDLYFRNPEGTAKEIQIDGSEIKSTSGYSHEAARLAFITQGTISSLASNQSAGAFLNIYSSATHASIYEPNAYEHTIDGIDDVAANTKISDTINTKVSGDDGDYYNYRAITKTSSSATVYHDRYTGETYTQATRDENFPAEDTTYYIMSNGVSEWSESSDYTGMTNQQVYDYLTNKDNPDTDFFKYDEETSKYVKVEGLYTGTGADRVIVDSELVKYPTLYMYKALTVYTKSAGDVLAPVETVKDDTATFITLAPQTVTKVTVYIWVEGQDADCTNTVAGYDFDVSLKFSIKASTPAQGA